MKYFRPAQRYLVVSVVGFCLLMIHASALAQPADETSREWQTFDVAVEKADTTDRFIFVHVYAPWCGWCLKMEQEVYPDPRVRSYLSSHFVRTRLNYEDAETKYDYNDRTLSARELAHEFNVGGVPAVVILSPDGEYLLHLSGFQNTERLLSVVKYIGSKRYETESFSTFVKDK